CAVPVPLRCGSGSGLRRARRSPRGHVVRGACWGSGWGLRREEVSVGTACRAHAAAVVGVGGGRLAGRYEPSALALARPPRLRRWGSVRGNGPWGRAAFAPEEAVVIPGCLVPADR